jgi:hypothetical protein
MRERDGQVVGSSAPSTSFRTRGRAVKHRWLNLSLELRWWQEPSVERLARLVSTTPYLTKPWSENVTFILVFVFPFVLFLKAHARPLIAPKDVTNAGVGV